MIDQEKKQRKFYIILGDLFLILIFFVAAITAILPDQTYSAVEKRALAEFPKLSIDSVLDGSFMDGMEEWAADQFPYRDKLMQIKSQISIGLGAIRSQDVYRCTDGSLVEAFTMPSENVI